MPDLRTVPNYDPSADSVAETSATLCDVIDDLASVGSLSPAPAVNELFQRLVGTVVGANHEVAREVLDDGGIRARSERARTLSAEGEYELELAWARRVVASPDPRAEIDRFPYWDNYCRLARMEAGVLTAFLSHPACAVTFVGSGPLPLSAYMLSHYLGVDIDCLDCDTAAVDLSRRLTARLGDETVRIAQGRAEEVDFADQDVVVLAGLVGSTPQEKADIIAQMRSRMRPGALLLARSARGLRTLLYPPLDESELPGFDVLTVLHPHNDIVNSVVVARVAP